MKIGLALSGGGARGIAHLGIIKALEENGIQFSHLSGASAGAIIGALYAYGYSPDEVLEIIAKTTFIKAVRPAWMKTGLLKLDALGELLEKYMPENSFESLKIPTTIAATEIQKGKAIYFSQGELIKPILASSSIPVIFDPVRFNGYTLVDGGILDNLPVIPLQDKCDLIIGCHSNPIDDDFNVTNVKVMIERSLLMAINGNVNLSKKLCDVFIEPPLLSKYGGMDLPKAKELFEIGYQYTKENLPILGLEKALDNKRS